MARPCGIPVRGGMRPIAASPRPTAWIGWGAVEAAAAVDERNGPLAHSGLENAARFPQAPTARAGVGLTGLTSHATRLTRDVTASAPPDRAASSSASSSRAPVVADGALRGDGRGRWTRRSSGREGRSAPEGASRLAAVERHGLSAVVDLGHEAVVALTCESDVLNAVVAAEPERVPMVELQSRALGAPVALPVQVAAPPSVPFVHGSLDGGRDLARARGRVGLGERLPGLAGLRETSRLEPRQLLASPPDR